MQYVCKKLYFFCKGTMDGTRRIYISDANYLYMGGKRSIYGRQTICFQFTDRLFFFY